MQEARYGDHSGGSINSGYSGANGGTSGHFRKPDPEAARPGGLPRGAVKSLTAGRTLKIHDSIGSTPSR